MSEKNRTESLNLQPQSIESEEAVLGSMLASKDAANKVFHWLKPENFYKDSHRKIFKAMLDLNAKGDPIDTVSVVNHLKRKKLIKSVGGAYYITGLVESVPTVANVEAYSKIVLEKAILRDLILSAHEISKEAYEGNKDVGEILDNAGKTIFSLTENRNKKGFVHINPILHRSVEKWEKISSNPGSVTGIPSGLTDLDIKTTGFHPGDLIIIAGRPGMGKTALALTMARNATQFTETGVGIYSLEMSDEQLAMRLLCADARLDSNLIRTGYLPKNKWKDLTNSVGKLAEAPIYIDDTPGITVLELRAKARKIKAEHGIGLIIVDYLQLMSGPKGVENRQQEISIISRSLKNLAKELAIPVIALSQLSRAVENRQDKQPQLSDLRESGAIEQDADVVIFLYRKWIYSKDDIDIGKADIIVSKQRNGPTGTVPVTFIAEFTRFENATIFDDDVPPF